MLLTTVMQADNDSWSISCDVCTKYNHDMCCLVLMLGDVRQIGITTIHSVIDTSRLEHKSQGLKAKKLYLDVLYLLPFGPGLSRDRQLRKQNVVSVFSARGFAVMV